MKESTTSYYCIANGEKVYLSEYKLRHSSYFLGGYQDEKEKGLLYTMYLDNGTTLGPVYDEKTGKTPCFPEFAGKEVHQTNFMN